MVNNIFKKIALVLITSWFVFGVSPALAQITPAAAPSFEYKTLTSLPGFTKSDCIPSDKDNACTVTVDKLALGKFLQTAFNYIIGLAIAAAVIRIMYGGVLYATTDAVTGKNTGKSYITNAVYGLLMALFSWLLLNTINPDLLKFDLNIGRLDQATQPPLTVTELTEGVAPHNSGKSEVPVVSGDAQSAARSVLANKKITLYSSDCCAAGAKDTFSAASVSVSNTANGQPAKTSARSDVGVQSVKLSARMLDAMNNLAASDGFSFRVVSITNGDHSSNSAHYDGRAFDVDIINGRKVNSSNPDYRRFMAACQSRGGRAIGPGSPGHSTHVHCGF